jgi:hypothetical protein
MTTYHIKTGKESTLEAYTSIYYIYNGVYTYLHIHMDIYMYICVYTPICVPLMMNIVTIEL